MKPGDLAHMRSVMERIRALHIEDMLSRAVRRRGGTFKGAAMRSTSGDALRFGIPPMSGKDFANLLTYAGRSLGLLDQKTA